MMQEEGVKYPTFTVSPLLREGMKHRCGFNSAATKMKEGEGFVLCVCGPEYIALGITWIISDIQQATACSNYVYVYPGYACSSIL